MALGRYEDRMKDIMVALVNLVLKIADLTVKSCLNQHAESQRDCYRLWLGMKLFNLYTVELVMLERIIQKFPDLKQGVIVDKVTPNSLAASAGIESQDIIIQCDGEVVESCLQLAPAVPNSFGVIKCLSIPHLLM